MDNIKKKILYIDPLLQNGHVNFNNIYIESLKKSGYDLDFVFIRNYDKLLNIDTSKVIYSIPEFFFKKDFGKMGNRVFYFISLLLLRLFVSFKRYDAVIFSSFEEISFYFSGIKKCYLINHINVSTSIGSKMKAYFLDKVLSKNTLIVMDTEIKKYLNSMGKYDVMIQPHGLTGVKSVVDIGIQNESNYIFNKAKNFRKVIFSPSEGSSDMSFVNELIKSDQFLRYIENENILFIIKGKILANHNNILVLKKFLDKEVYDNLFLKSDIVLVAYPDDFEYRVSGVLLECVANNKPCAVSKIDAFLSYADYFNYYPFFSKIDELIEVFSALDKAGQNNAEYYKDLAGLEPDFSGCFEDAKN